MRYFIVTIGINVSGYEKSVQHLVQATTEEEAKHKALEDERHDDLIEEDNGSYWDDIFLYHISYTKIVSSEEAEIYKSITKRY